MLSDLSPPPACTSLASPPPRLLSLFLCLPPQQALLPAGGARRQTGGTGRGLKSRELGLRIDRSSQLARDAGHRPARTSPCLPRL